MSRAARIREWRATGRLGWATSSSRTSCGVIRRQFQSARRLKTCSVSTTSTSTCTSRGCCKIDQLRRSLSVEMRVMSVCVFCLSARQGIPDRGVRLVSLGQTDGQLATAELEGSVLTASAQAKNATIDDLATATFMVDLVSMARETQYKRV